MKTVVIAVFAMMMGSVAWAADANAQKAAAVVAGEQKSLQTLIGRVDTAITRNDFNVLNYDVDPNATIVDSQGRQLTRDKWIENMRAGTTKFQSITRENDQIRVYDNTAVDTATLNVKGKEANRDVSGRYAFTSVWVREGGRWKAVASQMTPVAPGGK